MREETISAGVKCGWGLIYIYSHISAYMSNINILYNIIIYYTLYAILSIIICYIFNAY